MSKKTRQRLVQAFAIVAIIGMIVSSFAGSLVYLF